MNNFNNMTFEKIGIQIIEKFISAFNARQYQLMSDLLNYPHIRFANGKAWILSKEEFLKSQQNVTKLLNKEDWSHTEIKNIETINSGEEKSHFKVHFIRFNSKNNEIHDFESLWIITKVKGKWGIQFRSTFLNSPAATFGSEIK
tara:strand:+ start:498 stop:929 length:432 start_codon:yes stop_codon:yes gene_type:complete